VRKYHGYILGVRIEASAFPAFANFVQEGREHGRDATADDDDVGLQQIDDIPEPVGQQIQRFTHHAFRDGVTRGVGLGHHLTGHRLGIAASHFQQNGFRILGQLLARASSDGGARRENLDAAALAARAKRTVGVDAHVAAFGGGPRAAVINAAVEDDSRADTGADGGVKNVAKAASRAPFCFR
jgi:hypothetical protein